MADFYFGFLLMGPRTIEFVAAGLPRIPVHRFKDENGRELHLILLTFLGKE